MTERKTIYLDDALEAIRKLPNAGIYWFVSAEAVFDALLKLPSATKLEAKELQDVKVERDYWKQRTKYAERPKGEWIIDKDCEGKSRYVTCNLCGHNEFNWHNPNYCENCGAEMRGEEYETD